MSLFASLIKDEEEKMKALQELQVNGEDVEDDDDDFNIGEDEDDTPSDQADDAATEEDTDVGEDDMADEEEDDFTLDDDEDLEDVEDAPAEEDPADDAPTEDEPATDEGNAEEDAENADAPAEGGEDAAPDVEGGGDDDFTMDGTEGGEEGTEEGGGDVGGDTTTTNDTLPADPSDGLSDEDMKESEKQIYDSLTDNQKRIRVLQLKIDFRDLYETIITTTEGVNNIPKNNDNLISISRLIGALDKMKQILIDYVGNNFDKMSYLENYAIYLKYMAAFRTISKVIEEMNKTKD